MLKQEKMLLIGINNIPHGLMIIKLIKFQIITNYKLNNLKIKNMINNNKIICLNILMK